MEEARRIPAEVSPRQRLALLLGSVIALLVLLDRLSGPADAPFLDIGGEQTVATWFTSTQFAFAAAASAIAGRVGGPQEAWYPIAAVMLVFSIDEIAGFHERFEEQVGGAAVVQVAWPLAGLLVFALAVRVVKRLDATAKTWILGAVACLVFAQAAAAVNSASELEGFLSSVLVVAEEGFEMLVGTCVLAAALPLARRGKGSRAGLVA